MDKKELARQIFASVASEVAKVNEIWLEPEDPEGVKGWTRDTGYFRQEVHEQLKNVAEFAKNAADIFEGAREKNG